MRWRKCYNLCHSNSRHTLLTSGLTSEVKKYPSRLEQTFCTSCRGMSTELFPDETWKLLANTTLTFTLSDISLKLCFPYWVSLFCHPGHGELCCGNVCMLYSSPKGIFWSLSCLLSPLHFFWYVNGVAQGSLGVDLRSSRFCLLSHALPVLAVMWTPCDPL